MLVTTTEDKLLCFCFTKEFKAKKLLDTVARCQENIRMDEGNSVFMTEVRQLHPTSIQFLNNLKTNKKKKDNLQTKSIPFLNNVKTKKKKEDNLQTKKSTKPKTVSSKQNISAKGKTVHKMQTVRLHYTAMKMDVIGFRFNSGESKVSCSLYGLLPLHQRHW